MADCEHDDCGILCDEAILVERLALRQAGGQGRSLTVEHIRAEGLLREGQTTRTAIARQTGLSHQTVCRMADEMGVSVPDGRPRTDDSKVDALVARRRQGWSVRAIAKELGISKSAVSRQLSRLVQQREGALVGSAGASYQGG